MGEIVATAFVGYTAVFWFWVFISGELYDWPTWLAVYCAGLVLIGAIIWWVWRNQEKNS